MKKLLLPIDASEVPEKVMIYLKELVPAMDYEVTLLRVIAPDQMLIHGDEYGVPQIHHRKLVELSEDMMAVFENKLREVGIDHIQKMIADGDPDQKIVEIAETQGFHLILMCSRGMGAAKRLLIGSVTNKVVHHTSVPVLVIQQ